MPQAKFARRLMRGGGRTASWLRLCLTVRVCTYGMSKNSVRSWRPAKRLSSKGSDDQGRGRHCLDGCVHRASWVLTEAV